MVNLTGTATEIGLLWGEINRSDILAHLQEFLRIARDDHALTETVLVKRSQPQARIIELLAPHWQEESLAIASAAGVPHDLYQACLVGKYRKLLFSEDCTSYAAVGSASADGRPLFHKNRDNPARPQTFYRKHTNGLLPYLSVGDTSDTGCMMMVNAAGLAGSADVAQPEPDPYYRGLMNPYGLRHIAETATTCEEAVEILRMMTDRGWYAGGTWATNWTFADATGRAMVVFNAHKKLEVVADTRDGHVQTAEREGLLDFLASKPLTLADLNAASRLPGVCVASNCSSLTVVIDPDHPETLTCAWAALGKADETLYAPLYLGAEGTPRDYVDGTLFSYWHRRPEPEWVGEWEKSREDAARQAEQDARTSLADHQSVRATLTQVGKDAAEDLARRFGGLPSL